MISPLELFSRLASNPSESLPLWPFSILTLKRNLSGIPYPQKLSPSGKKETLQKLQEVFIQHPLLKQLASITSGSVSQVELGMLKERLLLPTYLPNQENDYSMLVDPENNVTVLFNTEDHLTLYLLDERNQWHESIKKIYDIENYLSSKLHFSFSPNFGYLTSHLHSVGTGLKAYLYLHLPLLFKYHPKETIESMIKDQITTTIFPLSQGSNQFSGHLVVLTNTYTIGLSEDFLLKQLYSSAQNLMNEEKKLRSEAKVSQNGEIKDLIAKAFGVCKHSYQMTLKESFETISLLKLGLDLGWIQGGSDAFFNRLFFTCQDSHILHQYKQQLSEDQIPHLRAEIIHEALKILTLKID